MSIRLLLDENFPEPAVRILRGSGFDVLAISESHSGIGDPEVLALARIEQRWFATFDLDFGELLFAKGHAPPPAVILLRVRHYRPEEPARWVVEWAEQASAHAGMFTIFDGETMRSRLLSR